MFEEFELINREFPWFFRIAAFVFGACCGSFFNVVIYRVPAGKSVVTPGSHCVCGKPIAWYDNIPILSWFLLRGKARCCGANFSFQYPFVELLTGCLFMACWWMHPQNFAVIFIGWVFLAMLICSTFIDLRHMVLPDYFTVYGAVIGVFLAFFFPQLHEQAASNYWLLNGMRSAVDALIGVFIGSAVILWIALVAESILRREAMGFGDVVFMGCIGAFCGWQGAIFAIFGGAVLGTLVVVPMMILQRLGFNITPGKVENNAKELVEPDNTVKTNEGIAPKTAEPDQQRASVAAEDAQAGQDDELKMGSAIPFGPWLALGAAVYYIFLREPVNAYFRELIQLYQVPFA